jgi:hypothetical protein
VPGMNRDRLTTILGVYLAICAAYQIGLHFWPGGVPPMVAPRFGVAYLLTAFLRASDSSVSVVDLVLSVWQIAVTVSCFMNNPLLKAYIASEILFSLPTAFWIFSLLLLGGGHVFGRADSFIPLTVLLFFSAVPLSLAIYSLRRRALHYQHVPLATR